jgi:hypothetical protein
MTKRCSMQISTRIDCSPTEARRLIGQPDLLPLYQTVAVLIERWIMAQVARLEPGLEERGRDGAIRSR